MGSYDEFAPHFDAWQDAFGGAYDALILPRLLALLDRHAPGARRIADLGIGTGDLVVALARRGFAVVGVDVSHPMLAVARAKIAAASLAVRPELVCADIRSLALVPPADAAVCVYTVVNQLVEDGDLERLFAAVHASLAAGGVFVFELNLPAAYDAWWTGDDEVTTNGVRITRRHRRDPGSSVIAADVTIVDAAGSEHHDRILQRPYGDEEVRRTAEGAGFAVLACERYDPFGNGAAPTKALWTVQRRRT
jgi:SAM-dependent methyltransferase